MEVIASSEDVPPAFKQEWRATILRAAAEIFFAVGYEAASKTTICERVGGSKQTVYNDFRNRLGLFITLIEELSDEQFIGMAATAGT